MGALLLDNIGQLVQPLADEGTTKRPLHIIHDAALLIDEGNVAWFGTRDEFKKDHPDFSAEEVDLHGQCIMPGFVDSHTHVVFAGERIDEMERRCRGESYEEIAAAGGGIAFSASQMTTISENDLVEESIPRLDTLIQKGTTTCEIKSGYGLEPQAELKQLRAIKALQAQHPMDIKATVLAHVVPRSFKTKRSEYLQTFCDDILEQAAAQNLAHYCDIFIEEGAFSRDEARLIAKRAQTLGLQLKLHVDQLTSGQGAELAAELGALSADHLERISPTGPATLARAGVIATMLPACKLFLGAGPWVSGRNLRDAGCEVAVATDCNPGSAMVSDLPLCATMAATLGGLSLAEALWAITRGGAKALGLNDRGTLSVGERADLVVLDHSDWRALLYRPANPPIARVMIQGRWVWSATA